MGPIHDSMTPRSRGAALIEFALVLPFLFVVTFAVVDLSRAYYLKNMLRAAARQGCRVAAVLPNPSAGADYDSVYVRVTKVLQPTGLTVTTGDVVVTAPTTSQYKVQVTTQFNWLYLGLFNLFGASGITNPQTLTASAVMKNEGGS
jgi:Flp pilus assembly protein TadG